MFSLLLGKYLGTELYGNCIFDIEKTAQMFSIAAVPFKFLLVMYEGSFSSKSLPTFGIFSLFIVLYRGNSLVLFCISLILKIKHLFMSSQIDMLKS